MKHAWWHYKIAGRFHLCFTAVTASVTMTGHVPLAYSQSPQRLDGQHLPGFVAFTATDTSEGMSDTVFIKITDADRLHRLVSFEGAWIAGEGPTARDTLTYAVSRVADCKDKWMYYPPAFPKPALDGMVRVYEGDMRNTQWPLTLVRTESESLPGWMSELDAMNRLLVDATCSLATANNWRGQQAPSRAAESYYRYLAGELRRVKR